MLILGIYFAVSESTANNIFHYWIDILRDLLPCSLFEQFREKEDEYFWIQEILTELELIVDIVIPNKNRALFHLKSLKARKTRSQS